MKPRLAISFSGGRSSAVMLHQCLEEYSDSHDLLITFANTGCEHEDTLRFVDAADKHFCQPKGHKVVWIEAEIHGPGKGPTAKVVSYETASRNGEPFEAAIAKHGIFCKTHPQCTSRLKEEPMISYRRQCGWGPGTYDTAIGIRADEVDRMSSRAKERRFVYPLIKHGWTKPKVTAFMAQFDWDLKIPNDAFGNCVWCWKKSKRKLMTVAKAEPWRLDFPGAMERKYGHVTKGASEQGEPRTFFRGRQSAQDVLRDAFTLNFEPYSDKPIEWQEELDLGSGCGDSCEIGSDE